EIRNLLVYRDIISLMRDAVISWTRGECGMQMPMHLAIVPRNAEVHMKFYYRRGARHFMLKITATFPSHLARGLPTGHDTNLLPIYIWRRNPRRAEECRSDLQAALPDIEISLADSPGPVARAARLIVTATASCLPLLHASHLQPGTHISAVGSDSPGKQELEP